MKPKQQCCYPGCHTLVDYDQRYCSKHKHELNVKTYHRRHYGQHEGKYQQFYKTTAWRKLSHITLERQPVCVSCLRRGIVKKGDLVDHIQPIRTKEGWQRRLDPSNLQVLCIACHNEKTRQEGSLK